MTCVRTDAPEGAFDLGLDLGIDLGLDLGGGRHG